MPIDPNDDRIQYREELPEECTQLDNFPTGELDLDDNDADENRVILDDEYTRQGKMFLASDKETIKTNYRVEKEIEICDDGEEDENNEYFAIKGYPLVKRIKKVDETKKILVWNLGSPEYSSSPCVSSGWYTTGKFWGFAIDQIEELFPDEETKYEFHYGVGGASPLGVWGDCDSSLPPWEIDYPQFPVVDFDPNDYETYGHWTGDVNDYEAVIWENPISGSNCYLKDFYCINEVVRPNDAGPVRSDIPLWWTQIKNEGYDGKVIITTNCNAWVIGNALHAPNNKYINDLCADIGSTQRLDFMCKAWHDGPIGTQIALEDPVPTSHPFFTGVSTLAHFNSVRHSAGGSSLWSTDAQYISDWCHQDGGLSGGGSIWNIETLERNRKRFYFSVMGNQVIPPVYPDPYSSPFYTPFMRNNQVRVMKNLFDVRGPEQPE